MSVDKENTFRALADKPLLARKQWWCALKLHQWTPWSEPQMIKRGVYDCAEQYRACGHCNEHQLKTLFRI